MNRAYRLSLLVVWVSLIVALAVAVPVVWSVQDAPPTTYRTSWCPSPEDRAGPDDGPPFVTVALGTEPSHVLARLREIRRKAEALAPPGLDLDSPPAPGTHAELDGLIRDLIADLDSPATPEEPNKP